MSMYAHFALAPPAAGAGPTAAPLSGSAAVPDTARAWEAIQNTTNLAVLDDFIRQHGDVPVYGALARERREELAGARLAGGQQTAAVTLPSPPDAPAGDPCSMVAFLSQCASPLTAALERELKPKDTFRECENCPEMVVVPAGAFTMGSPQSESGRYVDEGPQHAVTIGEPFAAGRLPVTLDQFAVFAKETAYASRAGCSWRNPGFVQEGSHPVVCVGWDDAKAYVDWLARKTGKPYRLLSEAEWEYAARGRTSPGTYPRFWFGNDEKGLCRYGNGADQKAKSEGAFIIGDPSPCNDGYAHTSPVGHYQPNAFGLYDMSGDAWQWTEDCWHGNYDGAPRNGSAWTTGCEDGSHVVRGGSWSDNPRDLRAAVRFKDPRPYLIGFRVARTLVP
jgi:formylglycine-generating enzyme required for sulfatase activity